jgi:hypothetical protein
MNVSSLARTAAAFVVFAAALGEQGARPASANEAVAPIPLFFVSKSENKNRVQYVVDVDAQCRPVGSHPVRGFWQMLERGPSVREGLLPREEPLYGIRSQVRGGSDAPWIVDAKLRSLDRLPLRIEVLKTDSGCVAKAVARIDQDDARLAWAHVDLGLFGVNHVVLAGLSVRDGRTVRTNIRP